MYIRILGYLWRIFNWCQAWPIWPVRLRTRVFRLLGAHMHPSARIAECVYVGAPNVVMGKETFINLGSFIDGNAAVLLEDYVRLGPYVRILTGTHGYRKASVRRWPSDPTVSKMVHVKGGSWLGMGCSIMPGVTIGEGCVIAAGAVVIESTLPNGLYAGVPARRVKDLALSESFVEEYE